jgi:hypothetical protein
MEVIHPFFIIFSERLPINYTTLKLATILEEALGITKYYNLGVAFQTQDSCQYYWIIAQGQMKGIHPFL